MSYIVSPHMPPANTQCLPHRGLLVAAGVCGLTAILAGTFGAHGIKQRVTPEMLEVFQTGAHYHLAHAITLLGVAIVAGLLPHMRTPRIAGWCMVVGIGVFSGSLYALALTERTWLGMITPIGGVSFLLGWSMLVLTACRVGASRAAT